MSKKNVIASVIIVVLLLLLPLQFFLRQREGVLNRNFDGVFSPIPVPDDVVCKDFYTFAGLRGCFSSDGMMIAVGGGQLLHQKIYISPFPPTLESYHQVVDIPTMSCILAMGFSPADPNQFAYIARILSNPDAVPENFDSSDWSANWEKQDAFLKTCRFRDVLYVVSLDGGQPREVMVLNPDIDGRAFNGNVTMYSTVWTADGKSLLVYHKPTLYTFVDNQLVNKAFPPFPERYICSPIRRISKDRFTCIMTMPSNTSPLVTLPLMEPSWIA